MNISFNNKVHYNIKLVNAYRIRDFLVDNPAIVAKILILKQFNMAQKTTFATIVIVVYNL